MFGCENIIAIPKKKCHPTKSPKTIRKEWDIHKKCHSTKVTADSYFLIRIIILAK